MNGPARPSKEEFVKNVDKFVKDNPVLERFFKDKKDFIQDLAQKAADFILGKSERTEVEA